MDIHTGSTAMSKAMKLVIWLLVLLSGVAHAGTVTYMYTDPQGTVLAKANAQGVVLARYDYAPYGTSAPNLDSAPDGPGYTGHVNDPDTGLVYMQARYYDPVVGRFLSEDPVGPAVGDAFSFNRYDYANNNPVVNIDPFGSRCASSVTGRYNCTVDVNKGSFSRDELAKANKAYTSAVNALIAHSGRNVTVSVDGKSFVANAGQIAKELIKDTIVTSRTNGASPRAKTINGGIQQAYTDQRLRPITTIYSKDLYENRHQGNTGILRDLSLTFIHEGIHLLKSDATMAPLIKADANKFGVDHRDIYDNASSKLYGSGP